MVKENSDKKWDWKQGNVQSILRLIEGEDGQLIELSIQTALVLISIKHLNFVFIFCCTIVIVIIRFYLSLHNLET